MVFKITASTSYIKEPHVTMGFQLPFLRLSLVRNILSYPCMLLLSAEIAMKTQCLASWRKAINHIVSPHSPLSLPPTYLPSENTISLNQLTCLHNHRTRGNSLSQPGGAQAMESYAIVEYDNFQVSAKAVCWIRRGGVVWEAGSRPFRFNGPASTYTSTSSEQLDCASVRQKL